MNEGLLNLIELLLYLSRLAKGLVSNSLLNGAVMIQKLQVGFMVFDLFFELLLREQWIYFLDHPHVEILILQQRLSFPFISDFVN